ncbi:PREDICTED: GDSL esterase/lipase At2g04570-like [Nicotiana attenuata]|uniref:Gdsl esteraselipase n=1 Tax=Nicotiana attenuata TaxID=49451 RepID=A0A1J6IFN7_NICAT|nr:PREDICTED: GDSL esterase/lipase At2g04570-like [Nicotiana attenuata]OIT03466.1 gdsl esteraselipase [Nicotiana attenuata]
MEAHNFNIPWLILILVQFLLLITTSLAGKVPAIIVFGDSSVDAGNNNQISTLLKSNFEPYGRDFYDKRPTGRFCNGRIPPDFISEGFGLRAFVPAYLDPMYKISDFAGGVCFASAGTGYDNATSDVLNVLPLWKEVENYKDYQKKLEAYAGTRKAKYIIEESLYLISMGTNDILENYYSMQSKRASQYTIEQFQVFLLQLAEKFVKQIYDLGARKISLAGLPPMGCLPLERATNYIRGSGDGCIEKYNEVAVHFNVMLKGLVQKLNEELPGIRVVFSDAYDLMLQMIKNPSSFGFEVAGIACCGTGLFEMSYLCDKLNPFTCTDANKYVFWDSFHLTEKTNLIITNFLMKNVLAEFL